MGVASHQELTRAMRDHLDDPGGALSVLRSHVSDDREHGSLMQSVIAVWACYFGDPELALASMRRISHIHMRLVWLVVWRPLLQGMRRLPGFKDLLRDIGLVDYWRETGHWGDYVRPVGEDDFECT